MARPKNSRDYWKWRQARRMLEKMDDADKVGEDVSRLYAAAARQLEDEIEKIFFAYQQKWGLSRAEAERLLKRMRNKKTLDVLRAMIPLVGEEFRDDFKAQLEAGAYSARIKRLENLYDELDEVMADVYRQDVQKQREHYVQFADEAYNREIFEIQSQVGFQFEFSAISEESIEKVLSRKWSGMSFSENIWANTQAVADSVRETLLLDFMTGRRHEDAARDMAERFGVGAMQSRRIIRTESNYISGQVQQQAYEECGAERYIYVATLDSRTDEECGALDGKVFFVKDQQPGTNMHPMHPNCRCTTIIYIDEDTKKNLQRRARDPETGKNELVPAGTTYKEWYEQNKEAIEASKRKQRKKQK